MLSESRDHAVLHPKQCLSRDEGKLKRGGLGKKPHSKEKSNAQTQFPLTTKSFPGSFRRVASAGSMCAAVRRELRLIRTANALRQCRLLRGGRSKQCFAYRAESAGAIALNAEAPYRKKPAGGLSSYKTRRRESKDDSPALAHPIAAFPPARLRFARTLASRQTSVGDGAGRRPRVASRPS